MSDETKVALTEALRRLAITAFVVAWLTMALACYGLWHLGDAADIPGMLIGFVVPCNWFKFAFIKPKEVQNVK